MQALSSYCRGTLLILYTLSSFCTTFSSHCLTLSLYCVFSVHVLTIHFLLTPHTLVIILQMYPLDTVHLLSHCTAFSSYYRCDPPGAAHFSPRTADVEFLILQTFFSHHTPHRPAANVAILVLYIFSSHCTAFFLYCRGDSPCTAHFLSTYCKYDIPDTANFLHKLHPMSSYCRCIPSDTVQFLLFPFWYCTPSPHRCDPAGTAYSLSSHSTPSLCTADVTLQY